MQNKINDVFDNHVKLNTEETKSLEVWLHYVTLQNFKNFENFF